jgi:transmembrane sensor
MENNVQLLFSKLIENGCTVTEAEQIIDLLASDEDSVYKDLILAQLAQPVEKEKISDALYKRLDKRLQNILESETPVVQLQSQRRSKTSYVKYVAAAAVLIFLSAGAYFLLRNEEPKQHVAIQKYNIPAGDNKAILTLANGKQIILTDAKNGELANENAVAINKTGGGVIRYDGTSANSEIAYNTMTTPRGGQYTLILSDGTKVFMNAASAIKYPTSFSGNERKVELKGEAYFEVAHNKKMPFRVETPSHQIEVLGTHFNVNAYDDEPAAKTTLLEGSVKINKVADGKVINEIDYKILKPGEQATVKADIQVANADVDEAVAWKNGVFMFNDEKIESIMRKISRWYNVDVDYQGKITSEGFGGTVSRSKDISAILKVLEETGGVHFKVEGRRITVMP